MWRVLRCVYKSVDKESYLNKIMSKFLALTVTPRAPPLPPPPYIFVTWQNNFLAVHKAIISQRSLPQANSDHTVNDSIDCQVTTVINSAPFDTVHSPWERQMTSHRPPDPHANDRSTTAKRFFVEVSIGEFYEKSWRILNFEFVNVKLSLPMPWCCVRGSGGLAPPIPSLSNEWR